jgi:NADH-quinone oxidoreductase subunit K
MMPVPVQAGLVVSPVLFGLGLFGVLARRNIIVILMSIEVMLNAAALAFVCAGARWQQADGQVMVLFILAMAAAEVAVGLALIVALFRERQTIAVNELNALKN